MNLKSFIFLLPEGSQSLPASVVGGPPHHDMYPGMNAAGDHGMGPIFPALHHSCHLKCIVAHLLVINFVGSKQGKLV